MISVTKAGQRKIRAADEIVERIHADVLATLPPAERKAFLHSLTTLVCSRLADPVVCSQPVRRRA